ncbi:(d)CMP kinase [Pleomorphovibrio marinus]|uniref:(d)CMP kinase n=1 Tax=Pleomorphovibrio marinus TaxID=2164132 RepID=UPI000E0AD366|nr:(d)CMP kinase [Pleomorphovibrio marinus]
MKKIIIAIDGFSGCGKSTTAKAVAKALQYTYIDSGAMYRSATLHFLKQSTNLDNLDEIKQSIGQLQLEFRVNGEGGAQKVFLNGIDVEEDIRGMEVNTQVSRVSKIKEVRVQLVNMQRKLGKAKGVVMDGRDIGTVVFPDAELKVFMTADLDIRAKRRQKEMLEKGKEVSLDLIKQNLSDRDLQDSTREESPLKKAADAVELDTSNLAFDEQVNAILNLAKERMN